MGWTTSKLVAVGSIGALIFLSSLLGSAAASVTGLVGTEAFINALVVPIGVVFGMLLVPRFGTLTLLSFVLGMLSLPVTAYGPPGFLPKVPASVLSGVIADLFFIATRRGLGVKASAFVSAGPVANAFATAIYIGMVFLFPAAGLGTGFEGLLSLWPIIGLMVFGAVTGLVGGWLGWLLYKKLENTSVVKRIQAAK